MKQILESLKAQTPRAQLIPSSYTGLYLSPYMTNPTALDDYYLGIKYKTLKFAGESYEDLASLIDTAVNINSYKWDKLYKTLSFEYDPIANVDAEIEETHDIAKKKRTETLGETSGTVTNGQAPFDSATIRDTASSTTETDQIENTYEDDAYKDVITTTRKGNIGVTSSQSLVLEERRVADFKYLDVIFKDIMDVIALPYFS